MNASEIRAEFSIKMLELEKAIDIGMPYTELKKIYSEIKDLQLQITFADLPTTAIKSKSNDLIVE